ncbi:VOC family protein [Proteiniclasticum sp. SCR006]|uniref:VOC family protein n=1 Tax=Proteiniclasticum aestuarii TaxID=2817862 RepID=A0A939KKB7_9CLOT|nr:VOC family protein [Proteiniclasticum aestuarii]MBO1266053.1 VOC family protein [Proteiniclasticum aestuarii]
MKFCWSTLKVKNLDESVSFYEEVLGLPVNRRFVAGSGMEIAFMGEGETQIELIEVKDKNTTLVGPDISWGFQVESLDRMMEILEEKGIDIMEGPYSPNPSTSFLHILDPNGLKIQLVERKAEGKGQDA